MACAEHGPTVAEVPWARHGAGHTRAFDDMTAWLAVHPSKTAAVELLRVAWATVGAIVAPELSKLHHPPLRQADTARRSTQRLLTTSP